MLRKLQTYTTRDILQIKLVVVSTMSRSGERFVLSRLFYSPKERRKNRISSPVVPVEMLREGSQEHTVQDLAYLLNSSPADFQARANCQMSLANLPNASEDVETITCGRLAAISEIKMSISSTFGKMWLWNVAHPKANNKRLFEPTPISTGSSELPQRVKSSNIGSGVGNHGAFTRHGGAHKNCIDSAMPRICANSTSHLGDRTETTT